MGFIVSYDDKFGTPYSEIELSSGEHIFMTLDKSGLAIKALARNGNPERVLFEGDPDAVADICDGLVDDQHRSKTTPLQILASAVMHLPNAEAVARAFKAAAA